MDAASAMDRRGAGGAAGGASSPRAERGDRASGTTRPHPRRPAIIIDTDLGKWWDDATAIGMANVLASQGAIDLVGITSDVPDSDAVAAIDAINTAYGHPDLPLGAVRGDTAGHDATVVQALVTKLPHSIRSSKDVPEAVPLLRRLLRDQPDHSVTFVALGAYTNLAGLLRSDRDLVKAKVQRLVIEDGLFPDGAPPLTNQELDPAAAASVVAEPGWPTPIAWVDGFTGIATMVGGTLCGQVDAGNPMRIAYESLFGCGPPTDGNWDGPTLLYAVGAHANLFSEEGQGGAARLNDEGGLVWRADDPHRHDDVYVHVADQDALNERIESLIASG